MIVPRLVIFDMDDVLCHYDLGRRLRALSRISGKMPRDIRAAIWDSGFEDEADAGVYATSQAYLAGFGERLGYVIKRHEWITARRQAMAPFHGVLSLAQTLARDVDTAVFTNNGPLLKESIGEVFPEAQSVFADRLHCSYEFQTKKPDPAAFTRLLAKLGRAAGECFFIDDKKSNVEGARLAGLQAHRFVTYEGLESEVRRLGLLGR
jgi:putative hydrolase of the HAD superfamily